jgi:hypothetical protein
MPKVIFDVNNRDHQLIGAVVLKMLEEDNKHIGDIIQEMSDIAGQIWHGYLNEKQEGKH